MTGLVVAVLGAVNVLTHFAPQATGLLVAPLVTVVLVAVGRRAGLSWAELGLARGSWRRGAVYGGAAVAIVGVVYFLGAAVSLTRDAFLDSRYRLPVGTALATGLVVVPLRTVFLEEVAFRGVLVGLLRRRRGLGRANAISSALFGLWHVLPSLGLGGANRAVAAASGPGVLARLLVVAAAVAFTGLAGLVFCELRRRSGSLLASAGLHWATNGLGVMLAAVLWTVRP